MMPPPGWLSFDWDRWKTYLETLKENTICRCGHAGRDHDHKGICMYAGCYCRKLEAKKEEE